jgi:hypothetical protein
MSKDNLEKFNELGKQNKNITANWHRARIPQHIKNRRSRPAGDVMYVNHVGGCGQKVTGLIQMKSKSAALFQKAPEHPGRESFALPGAGSGQVVKDEGRSKMGTVKEAGQLRGKGTEPYVTVLKDGFWEVGCFKDKMLTTADKYGNNADKYNNQASISVALYDELVLKEKKQTMTPTVCFEFCRTVPDMVFFGIADGRTCYCTPYFFPEPADESKCTAPCAGDESVMCGNMKGKASVFEMHLCESTKTDLEETGTEAKEALDYFLEVSQMAKDLGDKVATSGAALEKIGGLSGAPGAGDMGMEAKKSSKDLSQAFMAANDDYDKLLKAYKLSKEQLNADLSDSTEMIVAEHAIADMKATVGAVVSGAKKVHGTVRLAFPPVDFVVFGDEPEASDGAAMRLKSLADGEDYVPDFRVASYPFDATYEAKQSSCMGPIIGLPMVGLGQDGCSAACEGTVYPDKCVAYSFYTLTGAEDLCFMLKEVDKVETFTCPEPSLLQKDKADPDPAAAYCGIKMSEITTGYKPKGEWKKTDRCFGSESGMAMKNDIEQYTVPSGDLTMGSVTLKAP